MSYSSTKEIMTRLKEHYDAAAALIPEDRIVGIFLQGSQNYGMGTENSDIDTKCFIVPSFEDIVFCKKPISTTHILPNDEHVDLKDIRLLFNSFRKQNINFIEILFTKYFIINPKYKKFWNRLVEEREVIAKADMYAAVKAIKGVAMEKYHALEHPYPSKIDILSQFGYDPKQLHHLARLYYFLNDYLYSNKTYEETLRPKGDVKKELLYLKTGASYKKMAFSLSLAGAREEAKAYVDGVAFIADRWCELHEDMKNKPDSYVEKLFNEVQYDIMKAAVKKELRRK